MRLNSAAVGVKDFLAGDLERVINRIHRDLKKQTGALAREHEELSALLSAVSDAIMAVDKDGSLLISDSALAELLGMSSGHLNQLADRTSANRPPISQFAASSQVLDFNCDIKILGGPGGRRKPSRFYDQKAASELASRRTDGMDDSGSLQAAFETAEKVVDTNPFRREHRRMAQRQEELKALIVQAEAAGEGAEQRQRSLETQVTERADNQTAYQEFCKEAFLFPSELERLWTMVCATIDQEVDWVVLYRLHKPFDEAVRHVGFYRPELLDEDDIVFI